MNLAYIAEIQNRFLAPCTDLETLCKDIPLEIFRPFDYADNNGFYGIDEALKQYAGLPSAYHIKAHYSHASLVEKGYVWNKDYDTLPMVFTWAPSHEKVYKQVCRKPMHSIGPIIHYAKNAYTEEVIKAEKKRLGKNALFFPAHSSHFVATHFSMEELLELIKPYTKEFDTIRISIYWKDFLDGKHKAFIDAGYECVTSGHIFDPYFLPRHKGLLSVADHTFGNEYGTNIAYAIYMQTPFTYLQQNVTYDSSNEPSKCDTWDGADDFIKLTKRILQNFVNFSPEISSAQYKMCNYFFGYDCIKTRHELLTLLKAAEDFH